MKETYKFPNGGYDITIVRKEDILATIDENIVDKDIMYEMIEQLEIDASNFIKEGRWAGIPYMGNIRTPEGLKLNHSKEQRLLLEDAYENLSSDKYVMFRHKLAVDNDKRIRANRYYRYIVSMAVNKNPAQFRKLAKAKGDEYARLYFYSKTMVTAVDNEYIPVEDEQAESEC